LSRPFRELVVFHFSPRLHRHGRGNQKGGPRGVSRAGYL